MVPHLAVAVTLPSCGVKCRVLSTAVQSSESAFSSVRKRNYCYLSCPRLFQIRATGKLLNSEFWLVRKGRANEAIDTQTRTLGTDQTRMGAHNIHSRAMAFLRSRILSCAPVYSHALLSTLMRFHALSSTPMRSHLLPCAPIYSLALPSTLMRSHLLPCAPIYSHALSSTPMRSHLLPCAPIYSHALSSTPMRSHLLSCALIYSLRSHLLPCAPIYSHALPSTPMRSHLLPCALIYSHALPSTYALPCALIHSHARSCTPMRSYLLTCALFDFEHAQNFMRVDESRVSFDRVLHESGWQLRVQFSSSFDSEPCDRSVAQD